MSGHDDLHRPAVRPLRSTGAVNWSAAAGGGCLLARFKGASRYHTESGLRCYMTWSADMTWTRWPRAACTWSCTSGGCRRSGGVSWREWLVQGSVARVQGFLDSGQECCAAEP